MMTANIVQGQRMEEAMQGDWQAAERNMIRRHTVISDGKLTVDFIPGHWQLYSDAKGVKRVAASLNSYAAKLFNRDKRLKKREMYRRMYKKLGIYANEYGALDTEPRGFALTVIDVLCYDIYGEDLDHDADY